MVDVNGMFGLMLYLIMFVGIIIIIMYLILNKKIKKNTKRIEILENIISNNIDTKKEL